MIGASVAERLVSEGAGEITMHAIHSNWGKGIGTTYLAPTWPHTIARAVESRHKTCIKARRHPTSAAARIKGPHQTQADVRYSDLHILCNSNQHALYSSPAHQGRAGSLAPNVATHESVGVR